MSSFFLLVSLSLALFCNTNADLIGDICSASVIPTLCNESLRSDPRSKGADLRGLAVIATAQSISATSAAVKVATSLANGSIKQKAQKCVDTCNEAIGVLNEVQRSLSSGGGGSSDNLPTKVNVAISDIDVCQSQFGREVQEPPQLKNAGDAAMGLVDVVSIILYLLRT